MTETLYDVTPPHGRWMLSRLITFVPMSCAALAVVVELVVMIIEGGTLLAYACSLASGVGVALLLRHRVIAVVLVTIAAAAGALFAEEFVGLWTIAVFCLFVFSIRGRGALPVGIAASITLYLALVAHEGGEFSAPVAVIASTMCLAAAAGGNSIRLQRDAWRTAEQRLAEAAAAREARFDQALVEERLRIARDLHDTVGHEIAVVSINLGAAEVAVTNNPEGALSSLRAAREATQRTLHEVQQILRLMRDPGSEDDADRSEPARLEHLSALVERMRTTGDDIHATIDVAPDAAAPDVSVAAYRIVQEALTNAQRYGEGTVTLDVSATGGDVEVRVRNRIRRREPARSEPTRRGFGLVGMRERVASVGGHVDVTEDNGWFTIHARLPAGGSFS